MATATSAHYEPKTEELTIQADDGNSYRYTPKGAKTTVRPAVVHVEVLDVPVKDNARLKPGGDGKPFLGQSTPELPQTIYAEFSGTDTSTRGPRLGGVGWLEEAEWREYERA
jgi:hypothetical protein